ncbi:Anaphase-promoting complex subunit 4 [Frankliniella fusca]|uniref:Anaphase-promoting complex subunit 4 n=1 Tax=Frankliniella fusca TaxID=407009 RepID=A0AAE1LPD5_9NEOP|nr:Anaphase-promoting complex subunit 4 [Frankliniella fusca]
MSGSMRLLDERHVALKIELMLWSNKMDLLALSNMKGEVALHRLSWQRVWSLSPPQEGASVRAMAWRPDGKVIAIAYSTREVLLIDVENKETLHTSHMESNIISLTWVQEQENKSDKKGNPTQEKSSMPSIENASKFLPKLPPLSRSFGVNKINNEENLEDTKRIRDQANLNILLVGQEGGKLSLSVFGLFPCGVIDLKPYMEEVGCPSCGSVVDAAVSDDLKTMCVFVEEKKFENTSTTQGRKIWTVILETPLLASHSKELYTLALKQGHISSLQGYLSSTMQAITEAWESILLEMDSKLASYASTVADGSVAADFLDLLMLGVPSPELELFLQRDLTEKGLKKLSHSIELSYTNIQKFVLKHIHCVGTSVSFHLTELRGMARHLERYAPLGLREETVAASLSAAGAFLVKATEVQQVIDNSMKKNKAFFRWLFLAMLRLTDELAPADITKQTQQDLTFIADFLCNFDGPSGTNDTAAVDQTVDQGNQSNIKSAMRPGPCTPGKKSRFNLERLGQYLVDQELSFIPETDKNPWSNLLAENPNLSGDPLIIPHFRKMSLVQQHNHLISAIEAVFKEPAQSIGLTFKLQRVVRLPDTTISNPLYFGSDDSKDSNKIFRITIVYTGAEKRIVVAYPKNETSLYIVDIPTHIPSSESKIPIQQTCLSFLSPVSDVLDTSADKLSNPLFKINDMQFYVADILSLFLEKRGDDRSAVFVQFPLRLASCISVTVQGDPNTFHDLSPGDGTNLLESSALRTIDNFVGSSLAVSGSRKVAVVLSENRCKVRLFEMEIEEDEEEDENMDATHSTLRDSDQSHLLDQSKSSDADMD